MQPNAPTPQPQEPVSVTVRAAYERGDPRRYEVLPEGAAASVVRGLETWESNRGYE